MRFILFNVKPGSRLRFFFINIYKLRDLLLPPPTFVNATPYPGIRTTSGLSGPLPT